jgi:hypothetical protein
MTRFTNNDERPVHSYWRQTSLRPIQACANSCSFRTSKTLACICRPKPTPTSTPSFCSGSVLILQSATFSGTLLFRNFSPKTVIDRRSIASGLDREPTGRQRSQSRFHCAIEADPRATISRPDPGLGPTPYYPTWVRQSVPGKSLRRRLVRALPPLFPVNSR